MNDFPRHPFAPPAAAPATQVEPERVRDALKTVAVDGPEELVFDPVTGRVNVVRRGSPPVNDAMPATVVARSGFFGSRV